MQALVESFFRTVDRENCMLVDVSFLLGSQPGRAVVIRVDPFVYDVDKTPESNWVWHAFRGFRKLEGKLREESRLPHSFASVGTGCGVDAIGAQLIFPTLEAIMVTDVSSEIVSLAMTNIRTHVPASVAVSGIVGNICYPLHNQSARYDIIYANLPNLPVASKNIPIDTGTFYYTNDGDRDSTLDNYLLAMQYDLLRSARPVLNEQGSALIMVGGRFPYEIFDHLKTKTGYVFEELLCCLKLQTQAHSTISGYMDHEGKVEFDFYLYDDAIREAAREPELRGAELKSLLKPYRVSARGAFAALKKGVRIGHTLHMIRATLAR